MYQLGNKHLTVHIIDPVADVPLLGSRYCTGGYIWQISDRLRGPLLSGRCYPDPHPPVFDGQGAPEAFVTPLGPDSVLVGETVTVIGVGEVTRTSDKVPFHVRDNPHVKRLCGWEVVASGRRISMSTTQLVHGGSITLVRGVALDGRRVESRTDIVNQTHADLPLRWFAHPFFPPNPDLRCFTPEFPLTVPENPGYWLSNDGTLSMRKDYVWEKGLFQPLAITMGTKFAAAVVHPVVSSVKVQADFPLESLPVWANDRTFSPEPYMAATVAPGGRLSWGIGYSF